MSIGSAGQQPQQQRALRVPLQHLGEHRRSVVVAHDDVVAGMGVDHDSRVTEVPVDDTRLVLLVVVDPQLDSRLSHILMLPLKGPA